MPRYVTPPEMAASITALTLAGVIAVTSLVPAVASALVAMRILPEVVSVASGTETAEAEAGGMKITLM